MRSCHLVRGRAGDCSALGHQPLCGAGAGGLAFALAAKDSLSNMLAGVFLFFDKPFDIGDR